MKEKDHSFSQLCDNSGSFFKGRSVENYVDIGRVDFKARKIYIDHHKNSDIFWGAIFYKMPRLMKFSFKIAQRLHIQDDEVYAVDSFKQAISLAEEIISQRNAGHIQMPETNFNEQSLPIQISGVPETIFTRVTGRFNNFKSKLFSRYNESITRQYSETLLKYIESIDWHRDGIDVPKSIDSEDQSVRKVFSAISYIKSEIDDLLKARDASEKVLRESEARYRQLVEHAKAGILEFDVQENQIISVNDSFLKIIGYSKEEIYSMDLLYLMTEESRKIYEKRFSQRLSGEKISPDSAYQFISKSGQQKWVLLNTNITYKDAQLWKAEVVLTDISHLKEVENKLIRYQSKLKQLSIQLSKSEETQRRELASQLHESVSQELFAAQLKLNALETFSDNPKYSCQLEEIKDLIIKSIRDIRGITYDLSPPVLYDLGLKEAIESLSTSIETKYCLTIKTRVSDNLAHLDDDMKIIIYRIIKEITHNSIKHARADCINIIIDNTNNHLHVDVSDNGVGFDSGSVSEGHYTGDGFGLFDIKEKINHLGGHLTIHSTPGSGTRIGLRVPLNNTSLPDLKN